MKTFIYIFIYIYIGLLVLWLEWSPLVRVMPKTQKVALDASLLNAQQYKVSIKGKMKQSRERSTALPLHLGIIANEKGAFESPSTTVGQQIYVVIYEALCFDVAKGRMNGAPNETDIYIYIWSSTDRLFSSIRNLQWSWDRNPSNFTLDLVSDRSASKRTTLAEGICKVLCNNSSSGVRLFTFLPSKKIDMNRLRYKQALMDKKELKLINREIWRSCVPPRELSTREENCRLLHTPKCKVPLMNWALRKPMAYM